MQVEKSRGFKVLDFGGFLISAEFSTSRRLEASGIYVPVARDILSSDRIS